MRHYYLREKTVDGRRGNMFGCVVVDMNEDGTVNRGVSVCASRDKFDKTIALNIATGRFNKAVATRQSIPMKVYNGKTENRQNKVYGKLDAGSFHAEANETEKKMFAIH